MTMDEFSWNLIRRLLRTDDIHIGDVQRRDKHKKGTRLLGIFTLSHLPSLSHGRPISHPFHDGRPIWTT